MPRFAVASPCAVAPAWANALSTSAVTAPDTAGDALAWSVALAAVPSIHRPPAPCVERRYPSPLATASLALAKRAGSIGTCAAPAAIRCTTGSGRRTVAGTAGSPSAVILVASMRGSSAAAGGASTASRTATGTATPAPLTGFASSLGIGFSTFP